MKIKRCIAAIIMLVILTISIHAADEELPETETAPVTDANEIAPEDMVDRLAYETTASGIVYSEADKILTVEGATGYAGNVVIPASIDGKPVRRIREYAFANNTSVKSLTVPDTVTEIGERAFSGCTSLRTVSLGSGLTRIETAVFAGCTELRNVTLPDNLESVGDSAFEGDPRLRKLVIPASVTEIGIDAFTGCENLVVDVTMNQLAADYAVQYHLDTDFMSTTTFTVIVSLAAAAMLLGAGVGMRRMRRRGDAKTRGMRGMRSL